MVGERQINFMTKALSYSDVYLIPKYSVVRSRSECNTKTSLGGFEFELPVVPSNMTSVINKELALWLSRNNYFYIMHRFMPYVEMLQFVEDFQNERVVSISVGVKERDRQFIIDVIGRGFRIDFLTVDIAHGDSIVMEEMLRFIDNVYNNKHNDVSKKPFIIAGNVTTKEGVSHLKSLGCDCVKVGIGGGSACSTRHNTGFHIPMITTLQLCCNNGIPIIADGGARENGDIVKAFAFGSQFAMCGGIFSSCIDSPAKFDNEGNKIYFGSASERNKGYKKHIEGFVKKIKSNNMTYAEKLQEIKESLQSSVSYGGGTDLSCLRTVDYVTV